MIDLFLFDLECYTSSLQLFTGDPFDTPKNTVMRNFAALGLLGAAALAVASDVHDLKTDTFKGFVEENDLVLAECKFTLIGASSTIKQAVH